MKIVHSKTKKYHRGEVYHLDDVSRLPAECSEYFVKCNESGSTDAPDVNISDYEKCLKSFSVSIKIKA